LQSSVTLDSEIWGPFSPGDDDCFHSFTSHTLQAFTNVKSFNHRQRNKVRNVQTAC
jgi:hypothetical protein